MIKLEVCKEVSWPGKTEFPLEVAPEHIGTVLRGQGWVQKPLKPRFKEGGNVGKRAEGERAVKEGVKGQVLKFSFSRRWRIAAPPQGV